MNGLCCSMCAPGNRVYWHCFEDASTTCAPCPASTYTDEPNRLTTCLPCTVCEENQTLGVKKACTQSSNTVCGPLKGFYCINQNQKGSCRLALKHSTCSPGQYISETGTEFSDTVCDDCPTGSYSDGTLCKLHTKCESLGKTTVKAGTETSAECSNGDVIQ
ncbi:hypothetical protein G5714_009296 [Onychostoma macrolepis]|uniref:TNFR-Cys domain-containing protein n=1 Tax=Onychostoma macrolepis TaxID=369639 RepID=A0A7J6CSR6_9TELE|nr:hypothetical protein G5714_009296 [Onychostoma macrolepis]